MDRHIVFNLLIMLMMTSLVERCVLLQSADGQTDDVKTQESLKEQLLSSSAIFVHPGQDDTRTVGKPNHSDRKQEYSATMEYLTTETTTSSLRISEKARGLPHYWKKLSLHAQYKSRSHNATKTDSFTHKHSEHKLGHTNAAHVETKFEDNRPTGLNPSRIESVQSVPLRNASQSYHQGGGVNLGGASVTDCFTDDCNRQLCPWDYKPDTDRERSPITVWVASCRKSYCDFDKLGFWTRVVGHSLTGCDTVVHDMQVVKYNATRYQAFPVACICRYRRGVHHLTQKSSNGQSNRFSGLLKTGPMTHTVKLSELPEMIDGIEPEFTNRDLPVIHRNRKLKKHHGNDQHKRKPKRHQTTHNRDVKV